tara:strand:+ start:270 stop:440 length:171 start_codon:yes stop_codon:yes gene_type:complete
MIKNCCCCENEFPTHDISIYCDSCSWDLHYSRNWNYKEYTKEEWINEKRRERLSQM